MADEKEAAEAPKKKSKLPMIIIAAVVLLLVGGGAFYFLVLKSSSKAEAAPKEPTKGAVVTMDNALTINLADAHYLKLAFTLQLTADAGSETPDNSEAIDLAIQHFNGMDIADLSTDKGLEKNKEELLTAIEKAYKEEKTQIVMDIYITQFVTQ
jgi:flagellar FliL protein